MKERDLWKGAILVLAKIISQQPCPPREIDLLEIGAFLHRVTCIANYGLMPGAKVEHPFRGQGQVVGYHVRSSFVIVALGDGVVRRALDPRHLQLLHA